MLKKPFHDLFQFEKTKMGFFLFLHFQLLMAIEQWPHILAWQSGRQKTMFFVKEGRANHRTPFFLPPYFGWLGGCLWCLRSRCSRRRSIRSIGCAIAIRRIGPPRTIITIVTITPVIATVTTAMTGSVHTEIEVAGAIAPAIPPVVPATVAPPRGSRAGSGDQCCKCCNLKCLFHVISPMGETGFNGCLRTCPRSGAVSTGRPLSESLMQRSFLTYKHLNFI